ncbi:TPA: hypothetical protein QIB97_003280 [Proteus mirabilis]|nr:hypothetical protein [Proteus mirabilis]
MPLLISRGIDLNQYQKYLEHFFHFHLDLDLHCRYLCNANYHRHHGY